MSAVPAARMHPAVWIAGWASGAVAIQQLALVWLAALAFPLLALVGVFAGVDALRLLRRARWLLLAIAILFVVATPGERFSGLPGSVGLTIDGVRLAAEHLLRLVLLLGTVAWLLRSLGREGLVAGLHALLGPLGGRRDRLVVRLLLTLEYAEGAGGATNWRDWLGEGVSYGNAPTEDRLRLELRPLGRSDAVLLVICLVASALSLLS